MEPDYYDNDLLDPSIDWAELVKNNRDNIKLLLILAGIPALISATCFTAIHFLKKESL